MENSFMEISCLNEVNNLNKMIYETDDMDTRSGVLTEQDLPF